MSHMEQPPNPTRDVPMTSIGTRTVEDVIFAINNHPKLTPRAKSDFTSALRTVAKAIGQPPNAVPANPPAITRRLKTFKPAELGLKSSSWSNALYLAAKAFRATGCYVAPGAYNVPFGPAWAALADRIEDDGLRYGLSRFMHIASEFGWAPGEIGEEHFARFRFHLETRLSCKDPDRQWLRVRQLWNRAARTTPGWPQNFVKTATASKGYCFDWSTFRPNLMADVAAYRAKRSSVDLFSEEAPCLLGALSLDDHEFKIRQFASALVRSGVDIELLAGVKDLLEPDRVKMGIRFFLSRSDGVLTAQIVGIANVLVGLARFGRGISEEGQAAAMAVLSKVLKDETGRPRFKRTGMTPKNKGLLRQFDDPVNVAKIVYAPDTLCEGLPLHGPLTVRQAQAVRSALMVELLLVFPIRETNLASLRLDKHFQWSRAGRQGTVSIYIQLDEVKNEVDLEVQLPDRSAMILRYYLEKARPVLGDPASPWLFPGRKGHLHPRGMGEQFRRVLLSKVGLHVNMHFMRHLCAKLYLDRNSGQFETIRRALGHKCIETTMKFYAEFSSVAALKLVDQNLLGLRAELASLAPRRRGRRRNS